MSNAVGWTLALALALCTYYRLPWVRARRKRKAEQRITARRFHPATRHPARFYQGAVPSHEECRVLPRKEAAFARIAEELDFEWVIQVLKAGKEAQQ